MNAAYKSLSVRISKCSGIDDTAEAYMSASFSPPLRYPSELHNFKCSQKKES